MSYPSSQYNKPVHDFLHYDPARASVVEDIGGTALNLNNLTVNSITIGTVSPTPLSVFTTATINTEWAQPWILANNPNSNIILTRIGNVVTMTINPFTQTATIVPNEIENVTPIPVAFRPPSQIHSQQIIVLDNNIPRGGVIRIDNTGLMNILRCTIVANNQIFGNFTDGGITGLPGQTTVTYTL